MRGFFILFILLILSNSNLRRWARNRGVSLQLRPLDYIREVDITY
jgi:hypothetical protein